MEFATKLAWLLLAAVHAAPSAVAFAPGLVERLYGVERAGAVGLLLTHRGALFLAVLSVSVLAAFDPGARRAAALVVGISIVGYLILYAAAGALDGPLRTVALVDVAALAPLGFVIWRAAADQA